MAQSALTVTPENPTPPTNLGNTGAMPPNPTNYTKLSYADTKNWGPGTANPPVFTPTNPPPFYDDGAFGLGTTFATNVAALAGGSGATAGGTDGTWPWPLPNANAVPASTSVAHEGAGTEVVATQTYNPTVTVAGSAATYMPTGQTPTWSAGDNGGPLRTVSCEGNYTTTPNQSHASSLTGPLQTVTALTPPSVAHTTGTVALTVTGTGFTRQSVVYVAGVAQNTVFVSATSLTVAAAPPGNVAASVPVTVIQGGCTTPGFTWTVT